MMNLLESVDIYHGIDLLGLNVNENSFLEV